MTSLLIRALYTDNGDTQKNIRRWKSDFNVNVKTKKWNSKKSQNQLIFNHV